MKLKEIKEIGSRGVLFTFEFGDSVYLIKGKERNILCDTNEGSSPMEYVKAYLQENNLTKPLYIFNSHSDWDHIWGNYAFDCDIISSSAAYQRMRSRALYDLEVMKNYREGDIEIKYPTITFSDKLEFPDEGIIFMYAPSHTICSSICFDTIDKVIYAGDIFEAPVPMLLYTNLEEYRKSIEMIMAINADTVITTHSGIADRDLINNNYNYIIDVMEGKVMTFNDEYSPVRHAHNRKNLLVIEYEKKFMEKLGEVTFGDMKTKVWDYLCSRKSTLQEKRLWDIRSLSYAELEGYLKDYYDRMS